MDGDLLIPQSTTSTKLTTQSCSASVCISRIQLEAKVVWGPLQRSYSKSEHHAIALDAKLSLANHHLLPS